MLGKDIRLRYKHYKVVAPVLNRHMTDMQAAIGIEQLKKIKKLKKRKYIWDAYYDEFSKTSLHLTDKHRLK